MRRFDPFSDRRSRDIRNGLSEAFVTALLKQDPDAVQREVDKLMSLAEESAYRHYIEDRSAWYQKVLEQIAARGISDLKQQAIVIWNAGLYFECHDHLEALWISAQGKERKALQGLIQVAGVFVHRQLGRDQAANKLSKRAVQLIEDYHGELAFIDNIEDLIAALKQKGVDAPKLKGI